MLVVFLLLFLPLSHAQIESPASYKTFKQLYHKSPESLLTFPQFMVVDDFSDGQLKNKRGGGWETKAPNKKSLRLSIAGEDARSKQRGRSLKFVISLAAGETAAFESSLNRIDVSQAEALVFKIKIQNAAQTPFEGSLQISLTDWKNQTKAVELRAGIKRKRNTWQDVAIAMPAFDSIDLDQLQKISFMISAAGREIRANIYLDEVAFYGSGNVAFESHRDNLVGFPEEAWNTEREEELLQKTDKELLAGIARDTWKYFENAREKNTFLISDHLRVGENPLIGDYTSITNIAMDILSTVAAEELGLIGREEAVDRLRKVMRSVERLERHRGFFYNFYDIKKLAVTRYYISTVDSGWLAIALVVLRQSYPDVFAAKATELLDAFNFSDLLDPENNQLVIGLDVPEKPNKNGNYHYGMLVSEARAASFYAIGKGDIPREHWWFLYRTPPEVWKWQNQAPQGKMANQEGIDYFQGYYIYEGKKFVPSWGGSLFEFLMPTLVIDENRLGPNSFALNNRIATEIHRDYALREKQYPAWGISPAATENGRSWKYSEYGIKALSVKGYRDDGVIAPHVSFLALNTLPGDAIRNIRSLLQYPIYGAYGFYDSISFRNGTPRGNSQYLALDQGMILVAICNYLKKGAIQRLFHQDPIAKNAEDLLGKESFFSQ